MTPGWIWCEDREVVGVASDGVIVRLGNVDDSGWPDWQTMRYLKAHPTPEEW